MVGARGYSSYRGRGGKWKIFLAVLLVLVIAAACSVMYLQQYVVYTADGRRQIVLPWRTEGGGEVLPPEDPAEDPLEGLDVVVQEPPEPEPPEDMVAFALPSRALTQAEWSQFLAGLTQDPAREGCNAAVVRLKTAGGTIYYSSANAVSGAVDVGGDGADVAAALSLVTARENFHAIASMACLQDFKAANAGVEERGLKNTGGYIFYDGNNSLWLDPAKPGARQYVCALAKEIAEMGFDELLLTEFSYPTVGKINKINYNTDVPLADNLDLLLSDLAAALEPYNILLSVEIPAAVITDGPDTVAGLDLSRLVNRVDRIYAAVSPEQAETVSGLVAQAAGTDGKTVFVPELTENSSAVQGSRVILAE